MWPEESERFWVEQLRRRPAVPRSRLKRPEPEGTFWASVAPCSFRSLFRAIGSWWAVTAIDSVATGPGQEALVNELGTSKVQIEVCSGLSPAAVAWSHTSGDGSVGL